VSGGGAAQGSPGGDGIAAITLVDEQAE